MHTLIPALAFRDGRPWLVFGAMGGHTQAQTHLQMLTRICHDGDDPQAAISAPRWAVDPDHWHVQRRGPLRRATWSTACARAATTCGSAAPYDDGMGHAHAIECLARGLPRPRPIPEPKARAGRPGRSYAAVPCRAVSTTRIWTIPNLISRRAARAACPCSSGCCGRKDEPIAAAVLLAVLGATDWVDGYIARHFDQGSELGKVLDPTADRVLLVAAAVALLVEDLPVAVDIVIWIVLVREVLDRRRRRSRSRSRARGASTSSGRARPERSR